MKVTNLDEKVAMIALQQGMTDKFFKGSLAKQEPGDMNALQERWGKSANDLIPIPLDPEDPTKVTYIGASLQGAWKEKTNKIPTRK